MGSYHKNITTHGDVTSNLPLLHFHPPRPSSLLHPWSYSLTVTSHLTACVCLAFLLPVFFQEVIAQATNFL